MTSSLDKFLMNVGNNLLFPHIGCKIIADPKSGDAVDVATKWDQKTQAVICRKLRKVYGSNAVILAEEGLTQEALQSFKNEKEIIVLDPIDGTFDFMHGGDQSGILLAHIKGGRFYQSWQYQPALGRLIKVDADGITLIEKNGQEFNSSKDDGRCCYLSHRHVKRLIEQDRWDKVQTIYSGFNGWTVDLVPTIHKGAEMARGHRSGAIFADEKIWDLAPLLHMLSIRNYHIRYLNGEEVTLPRLLDHTEEVTFSQQGREPSWVTNPLIVGKNKNTWGALADNFQRLVLDHVKIIQMGSS